MRFLDVNEGLLLTARRRLADFLLFRWPPSSEDTETMSDSTRLPVSQLLNEKHSELARDVSEYSLDTGDCSRLFELFQVLFSHC